MSTTHSTDTTAAPAAEPTAETTPSAPARKGRRWPWIVAIVVVAALGATGTGIAAAAASDAQAQLAAAQEQVGDLQTRSDILESSLNLIREHRDRLELQLEELQAAE